MPTLANAGLPMLFIYAPVLIVAFMPVVLIEASWLFARRRVAFTRAAWTTAVANLASTVVGVPLTWLALVVLQMVTGGGRAYGANVLAVTWQAPWLIPYEGEVHWMVPVAAIVLSAPFLLVSAFIELLLLRRLLRSVDRLGHAVWSANAITYGLIDAFWVASLVAGLFR